MSELPCGELIKSDEDLLSKYAKEASTNHLNSSAVEIGTLYGRSTVILAKYLRMVYTIDVFENINLIENEASRLHYKWHLKKFPRTFKEVKEKLKAYPNIHVFNGTSSDKSTLINDDSLSLLFFDADHTFDGLKKDYEIWYPKLKTGGCLIVHDSGPLSHWMEPILFAQTLHDKMAQIDETELSTAWRKL